VDGKKKVAEERALAKKIKSKEVESNDSSGSPRKSDMELPEPRLADHLWGKYRRKVAKQSFSPSAARRKKFSIDLAGGKTMRPLARNELERERSKRRADAAARLEGPAARALRQVNDITETKDNNIKHFDISPKATILVAFIGSELFIKILNQVNRSQTTKSLEYQTSIAFMPIYLDEDYNFKENK